MSRSGGRTPNEIRAMQANVDERLELVREQIDAIPDGASPSGVRAEHGSGVWSEPDGRFLPSHPGLGVCPTCGVDLTVLRGRRNARAANPALWCWKEQRTLSAAERRRAREDVIKRWGA